jgi:hypothetical protein
MGSRLARCAIATGVLTGAAAVTGYGPGITTDTAATRAAAAGLPSPPAFPERLERYLSSVLKLTPRERQALHSGSPVTRLLDADPATEVAVFGSVWVAAPLDRYVRAINDIEQFEKGANFRVTRKLSEPPTLEDFASLDLPDDDVVSLRWCKVGECEIKLSQAGLDRIAREVDWSKPSAEQDAERAIRRMAFEYVNAYRAGGNASLAVYRDNERPTFVAREFESMVSRMPELSTHLPELRRHLLEYPTYTLPGSSEFFYFQEAVFGLKPTVRINHVVITDSPDGIAVACKQLYASHYFWTALELRVLVPDAARGQGFWFVNVNRSRSDGLSGFMGKLIRGKVRGEAREGMEAVLKNTKTRLEVQARKAGL